MRLLFVVAILLQLYLFVCDADDVRPAEGPPVDREISALVSAPRMTREAALTGKRRSAQRPKRWGIRIPNPLPVINPIPHIPNPIPEIVKILPKPGCEFYPSICTMRDRLKNELKPELERYEVLLRTKITECKNLLNLGNTANTANKEIVAMFRQAVDVTYNFVAYISYFSARIPEVGANKDLYDQINYLTDKMRNIELMASRMNTISGLMLEVQLTILFPSPATILLTIASIGFAIVEDIFKQKAARDKLREVEREAVKQLDRAKRDYQSLISECATVTTNVDKTIENFKKIAAGVKEFADTTREIFPKFHLLLSPVNPDQINQGSILNLQRQITNFVKNEMMDKLKSAFENIYNITTDNIGSKLELVKIIAPLVKELRPIRDIYLSLPTNAITRDDMFRIIARLLPQKNCYYGYPLAKARAGEQHFMYSVDITDQLVTMVRSLTEEQKQITGIRIKVRAAIGKPITAEEALFLVALVNPSLTSYLGNDLSSYPCRGTTNVN